MYDMNIIGDALLVMLGGYLVSKALQCRRHRAYNVLMLENIDNLQADCFHMWHWTDLS
jgi:hypothetical protein